jgi:hypothetical protein
VPTGGGHRLLGRTHYAKYHRIAKAIAALGIDSEQEMKQRQAPSVHAIIQILET